MPPKMNTRETLQRCERERDIAIDEAAIAWCEVARLREEIVALRHEKQAWATGKDEVHNQLLWHVGDIAETLWSAFNEDISIGDGSMTVGDARLLALESLENAVVKSETQLYEEMHELYAKIARMEAQHSKMSEKLRVLKRTNEALVAFQHNAPCARNAQGLHQDQASQTCESKIWTPIDNVDAAPGMPSMNDNELEFEATEAAQAISLLQAQLAMYVAHEKRHRRNTPSTESSGGREQ